MQRLAIACCALLFAPLAPAGVSGSVVLTSDYRFRGITLSDGLPALQLDLDWSAPRGWYAGAFASSARLAPSLESGLQWIGYAGYAHRINADWNWDLGADYAGFARDHEYDYPEIHFGLISAPLQLRVHYARHYFGQGPPVWYAEVDGTHELSERWRLLGHVGVLRYQGALIDGVSRNRYDARAGVAARFGAFNLQLAWVGSAGAETYVFGYPATQADQEDIVLSVSREW
ncbi:MAG: TorF family putative porin [Rhodanobacteraceae bacterium]